MDLKSMFLNLCLLCSLSAFAEEGRLAEVQSFLNPDLYLSVVNLEPAITKSLLESGLDVNADILHGETALMASVISEGEAALEILDLLLQHGADVNQVDDSGLSALHRAVHYGNLEGMKRLLEAGADIEQASIWGYTPLDKALSSIAIKQEHLRVEVIKLLLAYGADSEGREKKIIAALEASFAQS